MHGQHFSSKLLPLPEPWLLVLMDIPGWWSSLSWIQWKNVVFMYIGNKFIVWWWTFFIALKTCNWPLSKCIRLSGNKTGNNTPNKMHFFASALYSYIPAPMKWTPNIQLPEIAVGWYKSWCGLVTLLWYVDTGFTINVGAVVDRIGIGRRALVKIEPSSLMAAMEAGTRTGYGY